jgi:hypothetical protein
MAVTLCAGLIEPLADCACFQNANDDLLLRASRMPVCMASMLCQLAVLCLQLLMYHMLQEDLPEGDATFNSALSDLDQHLDFINPDKICGRMDSKFVRLKVRTRAFRAPASRKLHQVIRQMNACSCMGVL